MSSVMVSKRLSSCVVLAHFVALVRVDVHHFGSMLNVFFHHEASLRHRSYVAQQELC